MHGLASVKTEIGFDFIAVGTDEILHTLRLWQLMHEAAHAGILVDGYIDSAQFSYFVPGQASEIVYASTKDDVLARWNAAVSAKTRLNALGLKYRSYGFKLDGSTVGDLEKP